MLSIGEFSKICQVSVKTLHHYDKIGLLVPAAVNPQSGYRYYDLAQVDQMLLIARLKRYGFSLDEIRHFLACEDVGLRLMRLREQELHLQQEFQKAALVLRELSAHLENYERTGDIMDYQKQYSVRVETAPTFAVCASRQIMGVQEFGTYYSGIYERITRDRLTPNGMTGAIYHDKEFDPEASDIELVVGVAEMAQADKTIGGQRCACTLHRGAYSTLPDAYAALVTWIDENGYVFASAPFEIYRKNQFNTQSPEEWETDIYFPITK